MKNDKKIMEKLWSSGEMETFSIYINTKLVKRPLVASFVPALRIYCDVFEAAFPICVS